MDSIWVLGKDLIECVRGALSLGHANTDLSLFDAFLNFQKLFLKVKWRHELVDVLGHLFVLLFARDDKWAGEAKREM